MESNEVSRANFLFRGNTLERGISSLTLETNNQTNPECGIFHKTTDLIYKLLMGKNKREREDWSRIRDLRDRTTICNVKGS